MTKKKSQHGVITFWKLLSKGRHISLAHRSLAFIVFICGISIVFVNHINIGEGLKSNIIAEIIGSGIVAGLISYFFFRLQNASEYEARKNRAEEYYKKKALPDIQDVFESDQTVAWVIDLDKEFYLSVSLINNVYRAYEANLDMIIDYQAYYPNDDLLKSLDALYLLTRKAYLQGEVLDNALRRFIRIEHHRRSVDQFNDALMLQYLKARLFAGVPDEEVIQFLNWNTIPDRANEMLELAARSLHFQKSITLLHSYRQDAIKLTERVAKVIRKSSSEARASEA